MEWQEFHNFHQLVMNLVFIPSPGAIFISSTDGILGMRILSCAPHCQLSQGLAFSSKSKGS